MEPEPLRKPTRGRRAIAGALAAIAIGAIGIVGLMSEDEPHVATAQATAPPAVGEEPATALVPAAVASEAPAEVRAEAPGEVQMCGGAWVRLKDDGDVDWDSVGAASKESTDALAESVIAAMTSSADEQARAAALVIGMPPISQARVKPSACEGDVACERELTMAVKEWAERHDALARLAQNSSDPTVYGWAVQACSVAIRDRPGHCQVISAAQWARLDPTNAAPWMAVAAKAQAGRDSAALDDALFRISMAERYDPGEYKVGSVVLDHLPDSEASLWGTLNLVARGLPFNASQAIGDAQIVLSLCTAKDPAQDGTGREACERSAEMLVKGSATLLGLTVGRAIGKRVGWSQERIDQLQKESRALESAWTRETPKGAESLGCKTLRAQFDSIREFAAEGQVAALRRRVMEESARSVASMSVRSLASGSVPPR